MSVSIFRDTLGSYIGNAGHSGAFELSSVELFNRSFQVAGCFKLNKP